MPNSGGGIGALNFSLKVASRCNLDCRYCYVYNRADAAWRNRPPIMPDVVFAKSIERIKEHCGLSEQRKVEITFHGGEPLLAGPERLARWCVHAQRALEGVADVRFVVQTNATLIDRAWVDVLRAHNVTVGVSLDGPAPVNDANRIDKHGRGSHARVLEGIARLASGGVRLGALVVVQPGVEGLPVHRHVTNLGFRYINYLLPHHTHDEMPDIWRKHGPHPCADYLLPIVDEWWATGTMRQEIGLFWQMCRVILGGRSTTDQIGNRLLSFVFVEADGSIEGLDTLKSATDRASDTGLNVFDHGFGDIRGKSKLHSQAIFDGVPLSRECSLCTEARTCAGGHLGDRYSSANQFDNPSAWCRDLMLLFSRMRTYLDVDVRETELRRIALRSDVAPTLLPA